jgi:hypothetical protein
MSLINDALRRASQSDKDRPQRASPPPGFRPVPAPKSSRLPLFLAVIVVAEIVLASWSFGKWWMARHPLASIPRSPTIAAPAAPQAVPPPVIVKTTPASPAAPTNTTPPAPVTTPAPAVVAATVTPAVEPPSLPWPPLKLSGLFYSKSDSRVIINGNLYRAGDNIQGVVLKNIEKNKVTMEWNGHSKTLMMDGP